MATAPAVDHQDKRLAQQFSDTCEFAKGVLRHAFGVAEQLGIDPLLYPAAFQGGGDFDDAFLKWSADRVADWGGADDDERPGIARALLADAFALAADLTASAR